MHFLLRRHFVVRSLHFCACVFSCKNLLNSVIPHYILTEDSFDITCKNVPNIKNLHIRYACWIERWRLERSSAWRQNKHYQEKCSQISCNGSYDRLSTEVNQQLSNRLHHCQLVVIHSIQNSEISFLSNGNLRGVRLVQDRMYRTSHKSLYS